MSKTKKPSPKESELIADNAIKLEVTSKDGDVIASFSEDENGKLYPVRKTKLPKRFRIMRDFINNYTQIEAEFFSKINTSEIIFNRNDFFSLMWALAQELSNLSSSTGRKKINIGRAITPFDDVIIKISVKKIVEKGYGIAFDGYKHKEEIIQLLNTLHKTPLVSLNAKGTGTGEFLVLIKRFSLETYKVHSFELMLHKKLCNHIDGWGQYLQDIMKLIKEEIKTRNEKKKETKGEDETKTKGEKFTLADKMLLLKLGSQNRNKPFTIPIEELFSWMGKLDELKKNKQRVGEHFEYMLDIFKKVDIIHSYDFKPPYITFFYKPQELPAEDDKMLPNKSKDDDEKKK